MINPGPDGYGTGSNPDGTAGGVGGALPVVTGLLGLAGGLYDSHQQRKVARENTDKTIAAQKEMADLAYQREVEMWNMMNAYNTPQAQMNRFKEAGLNPHLIYGQGNAGSATSMPHYNAPNLQYRYEAGSTGAAIQSVLPTLMQVGTWMQDMRLKEVALKRNVESIDTADLQQLRLRQMIDYLEKRYPQDIKKLDNELSLFPYQESLMNYNVAKAYTQVGEMEEDFRYKYGQELFDSKGSWIRGSQDPIPIGGTRKLDYIQKEAETRLKQAQASWTDFDITNPQSLMQMVLSGVMGLAGQTLRLSTTPGRSRTGQKVKSSPPAKSSSGAKVSKPSSGMDAVAEYKRQRAWEAYQRQRYNNR